MDEIEPDRRLDLHLIDTGQLILDRVLDGEHLALHRIQDLEGGIKRGGLAAPRRSADENDAVGQASEGD